MKIVSIHQPAYLPWLGYFHKALAADVFVILDTVQFEKNSFTNRNRILQPDGKEVWLTIPVLSKGHTDGVIRDLDIDDRVSWLDKHFRSISLSYSKTPFWDKSHGHMVESIYSISKGINSKRLAAPVSFMLDWFFGMLGADKVIKHASDYDPPLEQTKSDLMLEICRREKADIYISGKLGKGYLEEEEFKKAGIKIVYQDYRHPVYKQHQLKGEQEFHPYMSIVDLLMNCGPDSREMIMSGNFTREDLKR